MGSLPQRDFNIPGAISGEIDKPVEAAAPLVRNGIRRRLRSQTLPRASRPLRKDLERACRIALMESEVPAPVEVIYDRIARRGSVMFLGYRRPFRAILSALSSLARSGEVVAHVKTDESSSTRRGQVRLWQKAN